jgi:NAD(P)-dependent dehydrogenase (short-subunit alcohol dehydrogenase family)
LPQYERRADKQTSFSPTFRMLRVPAPTRTEGTASLGEGLEQLAAQAPAGRPAKVEEIAEAIIFLATDRASFIQGAKLAVDGGRTAV